MNTPPRAWLTLEFGIDGSVEAWPKGDLFYLRESMRTLAGALLTEPATLDQISGAAGIGVDPSSLWITPSPSAQVLCESTGTPEPRAFRRGVNAAKNLADCAISTMRAFSAAILAGILRGFMAMVENHELERMGGRAGQRPANRTANRGWDVSIVHSNAKV